MGFEKPVDLDKPVQGGAALDRHYARPKRKARAEGKARRLTSSASTVEGRLKRDCG